MILSLARLLRKSGTINSVATRYSVEGTIKFPVPPQQLLEKAANLHSAGDSLLFLQQNLAHFAYSRGEIYKAIAMNIKKDPQDSIIRKYALRDPRFQRKSNDSANQRVVTVQKSRLEILLDGIVDVGQNSYFKVRALQLLISIYNTKVFRDYTQKFIESKILQLRKQIDSRLDQFSREEIAQYVCALSELEMRPMYSRSAMLILLKQPADLKQMTLRRLLVAFSRYNPLQRREIYDYAYRVTRALKPQLITNPLYLSELYWALAELDLKSHTSHRRKSRIDLEILSALSKLELDEKCLINILKANSLGTLQEVTIKIDPAKEYSSRFYVLYYEYSKARGNNFAIDPTAIQVLQRQLQNPGRIGYKIRIVRLMGEAYIQKFLSTFNVQTCQLRDFTELVEIINQLSIHKQMHSDFITSIITSEGIMSKHTDSRGVLLEMLRLLFQIKKYALVHPAALEPIHIDKFQEYMKRMTDGLLRSVGTGSSISKIYCTQLLGSPGLEAFDNKFMEFLRANPKRLNKFQKISLVISSKFLNQKLGEILLDKGDPVGPEVDHIKTIYAVQNDKSQLLVTFVWNRFCRQISLKDRIFMILNTPRHLIPGNLAQQMEKLLTLDLVLKEQRIYPRQLILLGGYSKLVSKKLLSQILLNNIVSHNLFEQEPLEGQFEILIFIIINIQKELSANEKEKLTLCFRSLQTQCVQEHSFYKSYYRSMYIRLALVSLSRDPSSIGFINIGTLSMMINKIVSHQTLGEVQNMSSSIIMHSRISTFTLLNILELGLVKTQLVPTETTSKIITHLRHSISSLTAGREEKLAQKLQQQLGIQPRMVGAAYICQNMRNQQVLIDMLPELKLKLQENDTIQSQ